MTTATRRTEQTLVISVDGDEILARPGQTVAAALLENLASWDHAWRPVCGMGTCWGCRAEIDGRRDQRTCLRTVDDGMRVRLPR